MIKVSENNSQKAKKFTSKIFENKFAYVAPSRKRHFLYVSRKKLKQIILGASITVRLTSCLFCLYPAALLMMNGKTALVVWSNLNQSNRRSAMPTVILAPIASVICLASVDLARGKL